MRLKIRRILALPRQMAYLLIRQCIAPTIAHLLRVLDSDGLEVQWQRADAAISEAIRQLAAVPVLEKSLGL